MSFHRDYIKEIHELYYLSLNYNRMQTRSQTKNKNVRQEIYYRRKMKIKSKK